MKTADRVGSRGSVLMEFLLVCPLLVILVSAILQFAHIWIAREVTAYAAFCATRAVLSANHDEQDIAALSAAQLACSWMALAGLPDDTVSGESVSTVNAARLHGTMTADVGESDVETVYNDDGAALANEIVIPGWGAIPGSSSIRNRVRVKVLQRGGDEGYAMVAVQFKFPLLMPLVGRMISWTVRSDSRTDLDYGHHTLTGGNPPAWKGEETVMDEDGNLLDRADSSWGEGGRFPVIPLTEACMLPMQYTADKLPKAYEGAVL